MKDTVALVAPDKHDRVFLAGYLRKLGFEVHALAALPADATFGRVVLCFAEAPSTDVWKPLAMLLAGAVDRLVVITRRPADLRRHGVGRDERMFVLVPPVFPWQLRDALLAEAV